jgi:hypothetical protein
VEKTRANGGQRVGLVVTVVCIAVLGSLLFRSYGDQARRAPAPAPPVAQPAPPPPAAPAPVPVGVAPPAIGRAELINAAAAAASAYAAQGVERAGGSAAVQPEGEVPIAGQAAARALEASPLVGRRFRLRLPFGCSGPAQASETPGASWTYSADRRSIRIVVRPETWTDSALVREIGGPDAYEAVEGFWIRRPWLLSEACPAGRSDAATAGAPAASPETVGLGMFFEAGGSRVARRNQRPFEIVLKLAEGTQNPAPQGFRLLLEGRVTGFPDGRAFRCRSADADQRPICLAGVRMDTVAVEDPAMGQTLGSWEVGQLSAPAR